MKIILSTTQVMLLLSQMKPAEKKSPPQTPLAAATVALSAAVCLTAPGVSPVIKGGRGTQASSSKEILEQQGGGEKGGREQSTWS